MNWQSHDLLAELICRAAGDEIEKIKVAGLILICPEWCWSQFLELDEPRAAWCLDELAKYVVDGDNAPDYVRKRVKQEATA